MSEVKTGAIALAWLQQHVANGPLATDDVLHALLPLMQQTQRCHENGRVGPFCGLDGLMAAQDQLYFAETNARPMSFERSALYRVDPPNTAGVLIESEYQVDEVEGTEHENVLFASAGATITRPVFLTSWVTWEHELGHHDALTDVLSLGLLLASIAVGLDLNQDHDLKRFVRHRRNLFALCPQLHPVVARVIVQMTEPSRHDRLQDLEVAVRLLSSYRQQDVAGEDSVLIDVDQSASDRRTLVLSRLRQRLFDLSKRNRLLYFKPSLAMVGLTEASIPLRLDPKRIREDEIFCMRHNTQKLLASGKSFALSEHLRFEDAPYLTGVFDRLRSEDRKNRQELGFSMMRMALVFLRWHNLKDEKSERIVSPLLLLPVALDKKKGVRDAYTLTPLTTHVEVNPVLRHFLDQLYGLKLPEKLELDELNLSALHDDLAKQIHRSEPGVELRLVDKPAISLIHTRARKRLEVYQRRSRLTGRGIRRFSDIDYSYSAANFQPLGMQLYLRRVKRTDLPLSRLTSSRPRPRLPLMSGAETHASARVDEVRHTTFSLQNERESNPYTWDLDACSMYLGNFNYQKMSLVRDYDQLLASPDIHTSVFDDLFTSRPRDQKDLGTQPIPWQERFDVVAADPTQARAVAAAREGQSFIIQGPPGTGKSQTITNLIADATAQGKRVLFVCEKRAALDVVYHRLKQRGLERLCCLIHDTQEDKKAFIAELRATYEHYCQTPDNQEATAQSRTELTERLTRSQQQLQRWGAELNELSDSESLSPLTAIRRLIELDQTLPTLSDEDRASLPQYEPFVQAAPALRRTELALRDLGETSCLGAHPIRVLARECLLADRVVEHVQGLIRIALSRVSECQQAVQPLNKTLQLTLSLSEMQELLDYAASIVDLSQAKLGQLLDPRSAAVRELEQLGRARQHLKDAISQAREKTLHWKHPFGSHEIADVMALCARVESSWLRLLLPGFWRLKRLLRERYDFQAHAIAPSWSRLLDELNQLYEKELELSHTDQKFAVDYVTGNAESLLSRLQDLHLAQKRLSPSAEALRSLVISDPLAHAQVASLLATRPLLNELCGTLSALFAFEGNHALSEIPALLSDLDEALAVLPDVAGVLSEFASSQEDVYRFAVEHPWTADQIESAVLSAALDRILRAQRGLTRITEKTLSTAIERLDQSMSELRVSNSEYIVGRVHQNFRRQIARASLVSAQVSAAENSWKKRYTAGRKELEHEFSKVMRYKSIRTLSTEASADVLADLKPVWLMSPLSISDTLALRPDAFDLVVFDEASQITLEEAVPALFRAQQAIVVGDEQQLPPTRFFGSRSSEDDEDLDEADAAALALRADSFLTHAAKTLRSTMLGWHYRSRYERLIDFSNASFYFRRLLTIPDIHIPERRAALEHSADHPVLSVDDVVERPVSFHYVCDGVYDKRQNPREASYIVSVVEKLLSERPELSIGVVAFSEAQQDEIERAFQSRCAADDEFERLYEAACDRSEDEQFVGLFVKNLENVQGDERDVIILSVCYGYDAAGKMRMNFGPINQAGGEKRLNVVFSRAKRHMVVVSSIKHAAITNDYNDGAACLKRYLRFAEAASTGDTITAELTLDECCPDAGAILSRSPSQDAVVRSVADWLKSHGHHADEQVGSSKFRVDLAVRGANSYRLAILVDTETHYQNSDVVEQYLQRPNILRAFGWQVERVFAKDWWENRAQVERRLSEALAQPH